MLDGSSDQYLCKVHGPSTIHGLLIIITGEPIPCHDIDVELDDGPRREASVAGEQRLLANLQTEGVVP